MNFAVIDTETNWNDEVMSLGLVIADCETFNPVGKFYYIFTPEYKVGGFFSSTLNEVHDGSVTKYMDTRQNAMQYIKQCLENSGVRAIFAYNAKFDRAHLPELQCFDWVDIIRTAAYKQYNKFIPNTVEIYARSGKMRYGYGVEPIYRMVTGRSEYREKHNGYRDAEDELVIMQRLGLKYEDFLIGKLRKLNKV